VSTRTPLRHGWKHRLPSRCPLGDPSKLTGSLVFARAAVALTELVQVAGPCWIVEERGDMHGALSGKLCFGRADAVRVWGGTPHLSSRQRHIVTLCVPYM